MSYGKWFEWELFSRVHWLWNNFREFIGWPVFYRRKWDEYRYGECNHFILMFVLFTKNKFYVHLKWNTHFLITLLHNCFISFSILRIFSGGYSPTFPLSISVCLFQSITLLFSVSLFPLFLFLSFFSLFQSVFFCQYISI